MNQTTVSFDSKEEEYFSWYLEELLQHGYIKSYKHQPKPFVITEPVHALQIIRGKKKQRTRSAMLLRPHEYQADFLIRWNDKAEHVFFVTIKEILSGTFERYDTYPFIANSGPQEEPYSVVDVKGSFSQNDAYRRFSIDQKLVFQKARIYVQKVIPAPAISKEGKIKTPSALFLRTFVPQRFLLTDKTLKTRTINFKTRTLNEFTNLFKP